jgi:YfiH family protein
MKRMSAWSRIDSRECSAVPADALLAFPEIRHGVTTRHHDLNLSLRTGPDPATVLANRAHAASLFGATLGDLIIPDQVHGAAVTAVRRLDDGTLSSDKRNADALVTNTPGVLLGITIADCLPVFLYDPAHRAIGLAHSGWRGTAGPIVANTLQVMNREFGSKPCDITAAVGPGIGGCCYEVGHEVREALLAISARDSAFRPSPNGRWMLDLSAIITAQLLAAGIPAASVSVSPWCTFCNNDLFFSHRKEGSMAGRMGAFLKLAASTD